jgi:hypothetical protein
MITCPRCGSTNVERAHGLALYAFASFSTAGCFLILGLIFWPFFIAFGLAAVFGLIFAGAWIINTIRQINDFLRNKDKPKEMIWNCKACRYVFRSSYKNKESLSS